jgi:hypothetical protein
LCEGKIQSKFRVISAWIFQHMHYNKLYKRYALNAEQNSAHGYTIKTIQENELCQLGTVYKHETVLRGTAGVNRV